MSKKILNTPMELFTRNLFSNVIERLANVSNDENFTFSQMAALHIIDREKTININSLATSLNLSNSATSRLINDLVEKEFILRTEDEENRRSKLLTLSREGEDFMNKLSLERVKLIKETLEQMPFKAPQKITTFLKKLF